MNRALITKDCQRLIQTSTRKNVLSNRPPVFSSRRSLSSSSANSDSLIFRQLFDGKSFTYTYLLGCSATKQAILIDPVLEQVDRDIKLAEELGLTLKLGINTHVHADHVTGTGKLKELLGSDNFKSVLSSNSGGKADVYVKQGDVVKVGNERISVMETPGHTSGCLTYVVHEHSLAMTGDTLLIRGCGRTDFQQGSSETLYDSIHTKIFTLPDHYRLYPGHDYRGFTRTSVYEEKNLNPRLTQTKEGFVQFMKDLNLAYPKLIDVAVPANLACGSVTQESILGEDTHLNK